MFTTSTRRSPVSPFDTLRHGLTTTRENGTAIVRRLAQVRRTTLDGVTQVAGTVAEHGRLAIGDTVDLLRKSSQARNLADLVALQAAYAGRRGLAAFKVIDALSAAGRSHALAIWTPVASAAEELTRRTEAVIVNEPAKSAAAVTRSAKAESPVSRAASNRRVAKAAAKPAGKRRNQG